MPPRTARCARRHARGRAAARSRVIGRAAVRHHPRRRALEDVQLLDVGRDRGDELDRRGAGADRRHPLAAQVEPMVPARRVERAALEALQARERRGSSARPAGPVPETSTRARTAPCEVSITQRSSPSHAAPRTSQSRRTCRRTPKSSAHPLQVGADLGLAGVGARPVRVGRERERVQVRGHVARAAGIRVVVPRPADARRRARAPTKSSTPSCRSRIARPMPEKPLPTMAIGALSSMRSYITVSYGSVT